MLATLGQSILARAPGPGDVCQRPSLVPAALGLANFGLFVLLAGTAGFACGRRGFTPAYGTLSGLLVAAVGSLGILLFLPVLLTSATALPDFSACPSEASGQFGRTFTFGFGSPPPALTPPPDVTPAPFLPPEAFRPPSIQIRRILQVFGAFTTILFGLGIGAGVGALGALIGGSGGPAPR